MKLFLCVLTLFVIYEARKIPVEYKLTKMQEDLDFLRFAAIGLRDDVELLLTWRNATLASEVLAEDVSKAGRIGVRGISKKTETTTMTKDDYANLAADTKGRIDYFLRGLEAEKMALREMTQGVRNETKMMLDKTISDVKGIYTKTEISQNTVEDSLRSIFSNMTKAIKSAEERLTTEMTKLEHDIKSSLKELSETQKKVEIIDSKIDKFEQGRSTIASEDKSMKHLNEAMKFVINLHFWLPFQNAVYRLFKDKKSNPDAMNVCNKYGAYLVRVNSDEEMEFLISRYEKDAFWIDGSDSKSEGDWRLSNGERLSFTKWAPVEPSNVENNEDCIHYRGSAKAPWKDINCESNLSFVCELDKDVLSSIVDLLFPS